MADTGFGQQYPGDSAREIDALQFIIDQRLALLSTVKIVLVKAVDEDAKTVDVQPMVNQLDGEGNSSPHGTIFGVSYLNLYYGKNAVIAAPAAGDIGVMMCADRDVSSVKAAKAIANPGSLRQLDAADGIYLGGILNGEPDQWVKFRSDGLELQDRNSNKLVSSPAGWEFTGPVKFNQLVTSQASIVAHDGLYLDGNILSAEGDEYAGDFHTTGTVTGDTDVIAGSISGRFHRHGGVAVGAGNTAVPH